MTSQKECPRCKVFSYYRAPTCLDCGFDFNGSKSQRLTIEYVKKFFVDKGYTLLETEYKNTHTKMSYRCPKGHESKITFGHFQQGERCRKCSILKRSNLKRHTLEYVKKFFADKGYTLLETEYKNTNTKMSYRCPEGHNFKMTFKSFRQGNKCIKCSGSDKFTLEYVKQYFEDNGCVLLEKKYINNSNKLSYKCSCGNKSKITFGNFRSGHRCRKCMGNRLAELYKFYKNQEIDLDSFSKSLDRRLAELEN